MQNQKNPSQLSRTNRKTKVSLPPIPDKLYFNIGEASRLCLIKPYVLRYWEREFPQLIPNKRRGQRRYYRSSDILLIRRIRNLLYDHGFTIEGARTKLKDDSQAVGTLHVNRGLFGSVITQLEQVIRDLR